VNGRITASDYTGILGSQVHPVVQMLFLTIMQFFKMAIRPYTQPEVLNLVLRSVKMHYNIISG
jgi:hypothetical protein